MVVANLPPAFTPWIALLAQHLHGRLAWRLTPVLVGVLFARGRRTVTSWLRAARIGRGFAGYYYFLRRVGHASPAMAASLLRLLLTHIDAGDRLLFAIDDTPTRRYGPKVQGAGIHHNPTPGPTDQKFLYGHVWVTVAWVVRHPCWGSLGLPLRALLYVRRKDLAKIPARSGWSFQTKLEQAASLVTWLAAWTRYLGKPMWVVVDGGYTKAPVLKPARAAGVVIVGRLRRDAALRTVPPALRPGQQRRRGRPRTYGRQALSLAKRAGQQRGWQTLTTVLYGQRVSKTYKTFLATWVPVGGVLRVVLVRERAGWVAFFCTDPAATPTQILEAVADRAAIEQNFHDLKEVVGLGQQQVRNVWANVGVFHMNLWLHTLVELWAWPQPKAALCDRSQAPWDDPARRPSHADRRKAFQRHCVQTAISHGTAHRPLAQKTQELLQGLLRLAF